MRVTKFQTITICNRSKESVRAQMQNTMQTANIATRDVAVNSVRNVFHTFFCSICATVVPMGPDSRVGGHWHGIFDNCSDRTRTGLACSGIHPTCGRDLQMAFLLRPAPVCCLH